MSLFGLEIGKRSIMSQQTALEVTGHNIANTNTPGYTRQIPNLVTTRPYHTPALTNSGKVGQLGTGVTVSDIQRIRDSFLDQQIRNEAKTSGYWDSIYDALAKIEVILNEPSNDGLRAVMDMYWESWQDLVAHPESEAVRATVAERGMALADAFNHMHKQLLELREDLNASVKIKVDEINSIATQIADLNLQILSIKIAGKQPNDLEDKRDLLLDQLSEIVDIKTFVDQNGMISVQIGGRTLVQGRDYTLLSTVQDSKGMHMVIWDDTKTRAQIESGELRGLLDARGKTEFAQEKEPSEYREIVPNLIANLNKLAKTIVVKTNELHRTGYSLNNPNGENPDGINFFDAPVDPADINSITDWAAYIKVNSVILDDPQNIAAAKERTLDENGNRINFGDARIALAIANLKHDFNSTPIAGITNLISHATADDFWRSICADVGVKTQEAKRMVTNQEVLLNQLETKRQSISGVSLDEELTNMIKFQHAYNAASRFITAIDEAIDVIVNRMGLVGR